LSGPISTSSMPAAQAIRRLPSAAAAASGGRNAAEDGLALYQARNWREGRTKLAEALRRDPRNRPLRVAYHLCVGYDLREQNRDDEARKQFESVLVLDPENADAVGALRSQSTDR